MCTERGKIYAKTFISEKPCKRGHTLRYKKFNGCVECIQLRAKRRYVPNGGYERARHASEARLAAISKGEKFYSSGRPCRRGHMSLRSVSQNMCVDCKKIYRIENREKLDKLNRSSRWKRVYGIDKNDYELMMVSQGNLCAICKTSETGKRRTHFVVDHCHKTGRVRGLLCWKCNVGLSHFKDDKNILLTAIVYLLKK